jgi:hypothetical protein
MRTTAWVVAAALLLAAAPASDDQSGINQEGFIQKWLVLAPIPMAEGEAGADALAKQQIQGEAGLRPKAGEKVTVAGKELAWKAHTAPEYLLDFNALLGKETEDSVAYAVAYVVAPAEVKGVRMKTGSDDQVKVFLNGKEVLRFTEARAAEKDQDTTEVTLRPGVNVLVVKVVNEKMDWSFCVRFTDASDKPLAGLTAKTAE